MPSIYLRIFTINKARYLGAIPPKTCNSESCPKLQQLNYQQCRFSISEPNPIFLKTIQLEVLYNSQGIGFLNFWQNS